MIKQKLVELWERWRIWLLVGLILINFQSRILLRLMPDLKVKNYLGLKNRKIDLENKESNDSVLGDFFLNQNQILFDIDFDENDW